MNRGDVGGLGEIAAGMAERGVYVFPLIGKMPPAGTNGFHDAVGTAAEARDLFAAHPRATGIGVDCGRSRLVVVDVDGAAGARAWAELLDEHPDTPETLACRTGRDDGGRHLWFRTAGAPPRSRRLKPKLDTRGNGGYVVAPPSRHPSGRLYVWENRLAPALAPAWLLDALKPPPPPPVGDRQSLPPGELATPYGRAALNGLADRMLAAEEGTRNDTLLEAARRAGRLEAAGEVDEQLARFVLIRAATLTGLPFPEADKTFSSAFAFGQRYPAARAER